MEMLTTRKRKRRNSCQSGCECKRTCSSSTPDAANLQKWADVFQNELIVARIAKHLSWGSLLDLRSVSTLLNRVSVANLKEAAVQIDLYKCPKANASSGVDVQGQGMEEYTKLMRNSSGIPFTRYEILSAVPEPILEVFLELCGQSIEGLTFKAREVRGSIEYMDHCLDKIKRTIFERTPKLVALSLMVNSSSSQSSQISTIRPLPTLRRLILLHDNPQAEWVALVSEIFRCAPGLESLKVHTRGHAPPNSFLASLQECANLGELRSLKLIGSAGIDGTSIQILLEAARQGLRLNTFSAIIPRYVPRRQLGIVDVLNYFLRTQAPTLQRLKLVLDADRTRRRRVDGRTPTEVRVPKMPEITQFEVCRLGMKPMVLSYDEGTLAQTMPKLKQFCYHDSSRRAFTLKGLTASHVDLNLAAHTGVESLALSGNRSLVVMEDLGARFPSLTAIELEIWFPGWRDLSIFWITWPELRDVRLHVRNNNPGADDREDLDAFLTGIPKCRIRHLKRELNTAYWNFGGLQHILAKYKSKPGISDLKHLQRFTLVIGGVKGKPCAKLGAVGGSLGLAMASNTLQQLVVKSEAKRSGRGIRVDDDCRRLIERALMPLAVIEIE